MLYVLKIHKICFNSKRVTVFLKKTLIIKSTSSKLAKQSKLGVVHKLRGQDEVGRWSVKCP